MTARDEAAERIDAVRRFWHPVPAPATALVDDLPAELLRRVADERPTSSTQPTNQENQ